MIYLVVDAIVWIFHPNDKPESVRSVHYYQDLSRTCIRLTKRLLSQQLFSSICTPLTCRLVTLKKSRYQKVRMTRMHIDTMIVDNPDKMSRIDICISSWHRSSMRIQLILNSKNWHQQEIDRNWFSCSIYKDAEKRFLFLFIIFHTYKQGLTVWKTL